MQLKNVIDNDSKSRLSLPEWSDTRRFRESFGFLLHEPDKELRGSQLSRGSARSSRRWARRSLPEWIAGSGCKNKRFFSLYRQSDRFYIT